MIFNVRVLLTVVTLVVSLCACSYNSHEGEVYCEVRPLQTAVGWGYEIYVDKKLYIRQQYIPAINGHYPFKSEDDAMKTGKLVLNKLTHGKSPAVTIDELKQLQIVQ